MSKKDVIVMPQINVNDTKGMLGMWSVLPGAYVEQGERLSDIETSKEVEELKAPSAGFFYPLVEEMAEYNIGNKLAVICEAKDDDISELLNDNNVPLAESEDLLLTKKARALVEQHNIATELLPKGKLLKEKDIISLLSEGGPSQNNSLDREVLDEYIDKYLNEGKCLHNAIIITGAGTTAKIVIDTIKANPLYKILGILDYNYSKEKEEYVCGIPVIGTDSDEVLSYLYEKGVRIACNSVASLANLQLREREYCKLKEHGFSLPVIVHPTAYVEESAILEEGVFVHAHAYVGSEAIVQHNTFINTNAIVSHDSKIGYSNFLAPNATVAGIVETGACTLVGMCATLLSRIKVGSNVVITNGSRVFSDVKDGVTVK